MVAHLFLEDRRVWHFMVSCFNSHPQFLLLCYGIYKKVCETLKLNFDWKNDFKGTVHGIELQKDIKISKTS